LQENIPGRIETAWKSPLSLAVAAGSGNLGSCVTGARLRILKNITTTINNAATPIINFTGLYPTAGPASKHTVTLPVPQACSANGHIVQACNFYILQFDDGN
jgi:hypothetical protein